MITGLLLAAVLVTATTVSLRSRTVMRSQALDAGQRIATLLARSAAFSDRIPGDVEDIIGLMMKGQAMITSHYVDTAERSGDSIEIINKQLKNVADQSVIDEFWITDEKGHAYLRNLSFKFSFDPDPIKQPQAHIFWPLLTGEKNVVIQKAQRREFDGQPFKYVGTSGIDKPRIVQIGVNVKLLEDIKDRIGLKPLVDALISPGDINAIWVLDNDLDTMAHAAVLGSEVNPKPDSKEKHQAEEVIKNGLLHSFFTDGQLTVLAPILKNNIAIGSVIVRLSTQHLDSTLRAQINMTVISAIAIIFAGTFLAFFMSRRITEPVLGVAKAALEVKAGEFNLSTLETIRHRNDELGQLAAIFVEMAQTVIAREEHLDGLVRERTLKWEENNQKLILANSEAKEALHRLHEAQDHLVESEKMAALGGLVAGVAHEINTPVGNSLVVATTLTRRTDLFAKEVQTGTLRKSSLMGFSSDVTDAASQLSSNLDRAAELIQSFKQVATDRGSMDQREFLLDQYVQDLLASLHAVIKRHPVTVTTEIPDAITMHSYPGAFGQVITNLIMNALTHGFEGRPDGAIVIEAKKIESGWVQLIFSDDGIGIDKEMQSRVFEPFFTTKRGQGGSGLGLHVVFNLVTQTLGGNVKIASEPGAGTKLTIKLPLLPPTAQTESL